MVHPPFAWQLASFPSLPVCGEEAPYCPLRDFATLRAYSPEIKAQQAIFAFLPVYPELVGIVGSTVPDYRGIFLRGHGSQTSTHYGAVVHSSAGLGQLQGDGIREISGLVSGTSNRGVFGSSYEGAFSVSGSAHGPARDGDWSQGNTLTFYASRVTPVVGEVRPVNRAVKYLIRAK